MPVLAAVDSRVSEIISPSAFAPGRCLRIGNVPYRVIQHIGAGAIGDVYEVENLQTKQHFAMKHLYHHFAFAPEKYYAKVRALTSYKSPHPSFVWPIALSEFDRKTRSFCFVMPLVPNGFMPLARAINNRKLLNMEQRLEICRTLAEAFSSLLKPRWVYGDCSPKNILFRANGRGKPEVRIIDCDTITAETVYFGMNGTGTYRAPEVLLGAQPTLASDAHALAAVMFHLLVGCNPLDGKKVRTQPFSEETVVRYYGENPVFIFGQSGENPPLHPILTRRFQQLPSHVQMYFRIMFSEKKLKKQQADRPTPEILLNILNKTK